MTPKRPFLPLEYAYFRMDPNAAMSLKMYCFFIRRLLFIQPNMYSSAIELVAHELVQGFARAHNVTVISSDRFCCRRPLR